MSNRDDDRRAAETARSASMNTDAAAKCKFWQSQRGQAIAALKKKAGIK